MPILEPCTIYHVIYSLLQALSGRSDAFLPRFEFQHHSVGDTTYQLQDRSSRLYYVFSSNLKSSPRLAIDHSHMLRTCVLLGEKPVPRCTGPAARTMLCIAAHAKYHNRPDSSDFHHPPTPLNKFYPRHAANIK